VPTRAITTEPFRSAYAHPPSVRGARVASRPDQLSRCGTLRVPILTRSVTSTGSPTRRSPRPATAKLLDAAGRPVGCTALGRPLAGCRQQPVTQQRVAMPGGRSFGCRSIELPEPEGPRQVVAKHPRRVRSQDDGRRGVAAHGQLQPQERDEKQRDARKSVARAAASEEGDVPDLVQYEHHKCQTGGRAVAAVRGPVDDDTMIT